MMISLAHYQTCAAAALAAATRTRGAAAVSSAHHARRLLTAFDALAPWAGDDDEPEEIAPAPPVTPVAVALRQRTDEERAAAVLAACADRWLHLTALTTAAHLNKNARIVGQLVETGRLVMRHDGQRHYYRAA